MGDQQHRRRGGRGDPSYLGVPSALLGGVEHLQSRLGHGLGLVQEGHLLLVVFQLGGHAHGGLDQGFEVTSQLGHLLRRGGAFRDLSENPSKLHGKVLSAAKRRAQAAQLE